MEVKKREDRGVKSRRRKERRKEKRKNVRMIVKGKSGKIEEESRRGNKEW